MLPLILACHPSEPTLLSVSVAGDQPLALNIHWAASDTAGLWLERTLDDGEILRDPIDPGGGKVRALGHPALSEVAVQLVTDQGVRSEVITATLGNLTPGIPSFTLEGALIEPGELLMVSTSTLDSTDLADVTVALDHAGDVVWFHEEDGVRIYRPDLLVSDEGWWSNPITPPHEDSAENTLTLRDWAGSALEVIEAPESHHVLDEGSEGMVWPIEDIRSVDGEYWIGDALLVDSEMIFSVWDDLDAEALIANTPLSMGLRFGHTNGLHYDAARDRYLLTLGAQAAVLELDAQSGEPLRWLGSPLPDGIELEALAWSEDEAMILPHMAAWTADGTLLLTGSNFDFTETWATEFALEDGGLVAVWSHGRGEALGTPALGHATRLDDGDTLINYGTRGVLQRVSADGEVVGEATIGLGRILGRAVLMDPLPLVVR